MGQALVRMSLQVLEGLLDLPEGVRIVEVDDRDLKDGVVTLRLDGSGLPTGTAELVYEANGALVYLLEIRMDGKEGDEPASPPPSE